MATNKFQPFFDGYLRAVVASLMSLFTLCVLSIGVLDWFFFVYLFFAIAAGVLHFIFLIVLYMLVFPVITVMDSKSSQYPFRRLMDRYIPLIAIPFALVILLCWMGDALNMYGFFVLLDILFTSYIGLYYYLKNKCRKYETSQE